MKPMRFKNIADEDDEEDCFVDEIIFVGRNRDTYTCIGDGVLMEIPHERWERISNFFKFVEFID